MNKFIIIFTFILISLSIQAQEMNYYWAEQFGNDSYANDIEAVTSDNQNHIICFTHFEDSFDVGNNQFDAEDGDDLLVFSVNEDGNTDWAFSDGGMDDQTAQEVACDEDGNIYLMGKFANHMSFAGEELTSNGSFDMYLIKLNALGETQWVKSFGGPNSESFEAMFVHGNKINLVGRFYDYTILENDTIWGVDGTDFFASQFDLDGNLIQYVSFGGESVDYVRDVTADNLGNIYIAGDFYQNLQIGEETLETGDMLGLYLLKLNSNLDVVWVYQPLGSDLKPGVKISCNASGELAMAGTFSGNITFDNIQLQTADFDEDIYLAYFTPEGDIQWAKRFYSSSMESVKALAMDRMGDLYISGHYLDHIHFNDLVIHYNLCCGDPEIFFVKLNEEGEVVNYSQLTGERTNLKDMYVPEVNQVILAGKFSEHLQIGDLELNSPTSYNVYLAYYKDDTWLSVPDTKTAQTYLVNSISDQSFQLQNLPQDSEIKVYNINGQLMEQNQVNINSLNMGENWQKGFYLIQIYPKYESPIGLKVLKM